MADRSPNILLLWTDQQRNDTLPCHGNECIRAPNLKRLGEESFVFRQAYCTQPVCTPSRASILTGLWPHTHGCVTNNIALRRDTATLAEMLPSDYECAYYGKWHLGDELSAQHGFSDWRSIEDGIYRDYYSNPDDLKRRSSYHEFLLREGFPPDTADAEGATLYSRTFAAAMAESFTKASYLAGEAERFLQNRGKGDRPFLLSVNFLEPHPPLFGPLNRLHDPAEVPAGPAFGREPAERSMHVRRVLATMHEKGFKNHPLESEWDWRRLKANYYGQVALVDRALGRIRAALEASGEAENTIIIYTSDHGEMLGDHGLTQKSVFFEEAVRIPWMIHVPWLSKRQIMVTGPVSQIDLGPTVLDLAGVECPDHLQGTTRAGMLRDAVEGGPARIDGSVVVSWNDPDYLEEEGRSLVTPDGWKLNLYHDDRPELFNLNEDPAELNNRAGETSTEGRFRQMAADLKKWQARFNDRLELRV
ncbi:MAG: sulfatase-like hydrolase/transferase [Opitutaceae bacterium]